MKISTEKNIGVKYDICWRGLLLNGNSTALRNHGHGVRAAIDEAAWSA
jgi:hypothetical protein